MSGAKALQYLNDAYLVDILEAEDWPFLTELVSGTAPMELTSMRSVEYVIDETEERKLTAIDRRNLTDDFTVNLTTPGPPLFYFMVGESELDVFPTNTTDILNVRYYKTVPRLTGAVIPVLPERFHSLIIDGAVARAYEDSDDYELAQNANTKFQERLQKMTAALMEKLRDGPDEYVAVLDPYAL